MYKDEIWYRKLEQAITDRRDSLTDKQWSKYQVDLLLKVANRVRTLSDECEVCRGYQHTLIRLEEEFAELPGSKAQRQYQAEQLVLMSKHMAVQHQLATPGFYLRKWLRVGLIAGAVVGFVAMLVVGNLLLLPGGLVAGALLAAAYGAGEDQKVEREHRRI